MIEITETDAPGEPTPPETLVIVLKKPVELGSLSFSELRLREPTGAEMIAVDGKRGWALDIALIALVAGVPEPAVAKIGGGDLMQARKFLDHFFE